MTDQPPSRVWIGQTHNGDLVAQWFRKPVEPHDIEYIRADDVREALIREYNARGGNAYVLLEAMLTWLHDNRGE